MSNKLFYFLFAVILIGLADATYLTVVHYTGQGVVCSVVAGCEVVLTSKYSTLFNVPISAFGVLYYAALFMFLYYFRLTQSNLLWRLFQLTAASGVAVTAVLVYLQLGVLDAICQYCMISALTTAIIGGITLWASLRSTPTVPPSAPAVQ